MESDSNVLFSRGNQMNEEESSDEDIWDDTALIEAYDRAVSLAKEEVQRRMGLNAKETSTTGKVTSSAQESHRSFGRKDTKNKNKQQQEKNKQKYEDIKVLSASGDQWAAGMTCRCAYHEDGILYEATIESISMEDGICMIKFIGYENTQLSSVDELLPSEGRWAQKKQIQDSKASKEVAQAEVMDWADGNAPSAKDGAVRKSRSRNAPNVEEMHHNSVPRDFPAFSAIPPPPPLSQLAGRLPAEESEALSSMLMSWYLNGFHTGYYMGLKQAKEQTTPEK